MIHIVAEGSNIMAKDHTLRASLYARPRTGKPQVSDLKRRAKKRKMLEAEMAGLREEGAHWDKYIKKTERKRKATKGIKTVAEVAELAAGIPAIAKVVGKRVIRKGIEKAAKNAIKITPDSKFAKRTIAAKSKEAVKGAGKGKPVHLEQTIVKGKKATTVRSTPKKPDIGKPRPKGLTDRQWENLQRGRKKVERIKKSPWMQRAVKTNKAQKNTPVSPIKNPKIKGTRTRKLLTKSQEKVLDKAIERSKKVLKMEVKPIPKPKPSLRRVGKDIKITTGSKFIKRTAATQSKEASQKATAKSVKRQADAKLKREGVASGRKDYKQKAVRTAHKDRTSVGKRNAPKDLTKAEKAAVRMGGTEGKKVIVKKSAEAVRQSVKATEELGRVQAQRFLARTQKGGPVSGATKAQKAAAKKKQARYQKAVKKNKK